MFSRRFSWSMSPLEEGSKDERGLLGVNGRCWDAGFSDMSNKNSAGNNVCGIIAHLTHTH